MSKPAGKTKILLATDLKEPITLHWALSKNNAGEWLVIFYPLLIETMVLMNMLNNEFPINVFFYSASFRAFVKK